MSQSVITNAFEQLKAQQAANGSILVLDTFVFANVPGLDVNLPISRDESWPADDYIVHRQDVGKTGMVNANAVSYSAILGADVGDFEFNWIGLVSSSSNTVCMIVHAPVQKKIKTAAGQQGNVLTRSFLMEYNGASEQTQIITPVDTWQIDFTARLNSVDERIRRENIDVYGDASFIDDGFLVAKSGQNYSVKRGSGYIAGLRSTLIADQVLAVAQRPSKIWADVCWRGTLTSTWDTLCKITVAETLSNYYENGEQHYVYPVAQINADGTVSDLRKVSISHDVAQLSPGKNTLPYFDEQARLKQSSLSPYARGMLGKGSQDDVLSYLGLQDVESSLPNTLFTNHSRTVAVKLPLLFKDHDAVKAQNSGATYLYPQGFAVTGGKIYLSYTIEPKQTRNVLVQYSESGVYEGYFYVENGGYGVVSEGLVVTTDYGATHAFVGSSNGILKQYLITGAAFGSTLQLVSDHDVGMYNQFGYRKGRWIVEQNKPELGQAITRTVLAMFDKNFNFVGQATLPLHDSGYITATTNAYAPLFNKRQGIALGDGYIACSYGGYFADGAAEGANQHQGVKVFSPDGVKLQESMLYPQKMIDILKSQGITATRIENEAVTCSDSGDHLFSMYVHQERGNAEAYSEGILIMKEFAAGASAIDFRSAACVSPGFNMDHASIGVFPRGAKGLVNPVTGAVFSTLNDVLTYMQNTSQKNFEISTSSTPIKDIAGTDIPTSTLVKIKNVNNRTFHVAYEREEGGIRYTIGTSDSSGEFVFIRQREATWSNVLTLANKKKGEDQYNRILAASKTGADSNADKILVIDQQSVDGSNILVIGGGSSIFKSANLIDFATNPDANATGGIKRWRIDTLGNFRPYEDNLYSLGQASARPKEVFSATSAISTSDRNYKDDIVILSDAEKRIGKKLLGMVMRYKFKDAIKEKGNDARYHFGLIAQEVQAAFEAEGLDAFEYGALCKDEFPDEYEPVMDTRMVVDNDGLLVMEEYDTGEKKVIKQGGTILSVREGELQFLMLAACHG
ncbi:phage tail protein [Atlantibacter sp.]|uniref:phage tail-collar fiber domain-containing protein n=1 Tax=Atlantibacter sp. TaxID=1903473 RepID=UPI0028A6D14D|nr:phage tail protein [Atlantibacter sp.]